jgi:prepilin-type N-terminal cleavage/methylation domain-containing protein
MICRMPAKIKNGFTLIELLVVIALIGILSTLVLANLNSARERSRDAQRKADLRNIQTAFRLYYNDKGSYPAAFPTGGSPWLVSGITYMGTFPKDPLTSQSYSYTYTDGDNYTIDSCLENKSDDKCVTDASFCPVSSCRYTVKP